MESDLRKQIKHLLVDLSLDGQGSQKALAAAIATPEEPVNSNSLCMALTGYRNGPGSIRLLERLFRHLDSLPDPELHK